MPTEEECQRQPWLPGCPDVCIPGGGGLLQLRGSYDDRWPDDHGRFSSWLSPQVVGAKVVRDLGNYRADVEVTLPNLSRFLEPNVRVTHAQADWDFYQMARKLYRGWLSDALKDAYAEWAALGHAPLVSRCDVGHYYPANHDFRNEYTVLEDHRDRMNIIAYFRRNAGQMFAANVPYSAELPPGWLAARALWLPIRAKAVAIADAKRAEYLGPDYVI